VLGRTGDRRSAQETAAWEGMARLARMGVVLLVVGCSIRFRVAGMIFRAETWHALPQDVNPLTWIFLPGRIIVDGNLGERGFEQVHVRVRALRQLPGAILNKAAERMSNRASISVPHRTRRIQSWSSPHLPPRRT
jgi:hypothetical protein